jgi:hypothetical protein
MSSKEKSHDALKKITLTQSDRSEYQDRDGARKAKEAGDCHRSRRRPGGRGEDPGEEEKRQVTFLHSGDLGDAIYALPSVRALGGGEIYFDSRPWTRTRWGRSLLGVIAPLIDATGFASAHLHDGEWIDHDFSTFRNGGYKLGDTIYERQRRWVGAERNLEPWLKADANSLARVVINRASRWEGWHFPWKEIIDTFYEEIVFIGLPQEHVAFQKEFGPVFYVPCHDLLEAAEIIAGAEVFIGNQSACNAIANGLGKKIILEVCNYAPDCFLRKDTSFFSLNGEFELELSDGKGLKLLPYEGRFHARIGKRMLSSDDAEKLKIIARSACALEGDFVYYEEVLVT